MKIFLSYSSEDKDIAEQINFALVGAGHTVFFDQTTLPPAGDYNSRISKSISESDFLIFLISPDSVSHSSYALTELGFGEKKWKHPKNHVLPVMVRETKYSEIPNFLKAVTLLEPKGNIAAEVTSVINNIDKERKRVNPILKGVILVTFLIFILFLILYLKGWVSPKSITNQSNIEKTVSKKSDESNQTNNSKKQGEEKKSKYNLRAIVKDPDGWAWLRKKPVVRKDTEFIKVLDGQAVYISKKVKNWWLVKTREGVVGYMHESRIKSISSR